MLWDSVIILGGECENIQIEFSQKNSHSIFIFSGKNIKLSNYEDNNLYLGGDYINIIENVICNSAKLGCICNDNIKQQATQLTTSNKPNFIVEDVSSEGTNENAITHCDFSGNATIGGSIIKDSNYIVLGDSAKLNGATINESNHINILNESMASGTINESSNLNFKGSSYIVNISEGRGLTVLDNGVILNFSGNGNGLIVNGESYINGNHLSSSVIHSTDYVNTSNVTGAKISNSTVGTIEISYKTVSNSNIPNTTITSPLKHSVYDDIQNDT